ncbi:MAG: DUF1476 domain-containing protein [Hyphomicrobiales bacterium]|nr:DUF1476 domain-containing protein [Hyphomicrobiales bacterium]
MTTFDNRQKSYESKFAQDENLRFRATARRNKLLGQWASEKLGLSGADAEAYVKTVIRADFEKPGDEDVIAKVVTDLAGKASEAEIRAKLEILMAEAVTQVEASS